jgi:hypothetical protein
MITRVSGIAFIGPKVPRVAPQSVMQVNEVVRRRLAVIPP